MQGAACREADGRIPVAEFIGDAALGGVAACLLNYYKFMDRSRYRLDFFTYGPSEFDAALAKIDPASRVFYLPDLRKHPLRSTARLAEILSQGGYAIAHSHMTTLSAFVLWAAKRAGVPVRVCHAHSTFDAASDHALVKRLLRPFAARYATHLMACGTAAAENLFRARANEAEILPNAVDLFRFSCGEESEGLLFVGRFAPQKNLFFLLGAFAQAKKLAPSLTLTLAGDGPLRAELCERAKKLGIAESVHFAGACDPAPLYARASAFVLPSLYEGMPVVAAEAQASGLRCLFSDKITREADIAGGSVFLPLDEQVWAREMAKPHEKDPASKAALCAAHYDIRREADRLPAFYDKALGSEGVQR